SNPIQVANLQRKVAQTWAIQHHYDEGLRFFNMAESTLSLAAPETNTEWWQAWIEIGLERDWWVHYFQGRIPEFTASVEKIRPTIEAHATPRQRGKYFQNQVLLALRRDLYIVSEEAVDLARAALTAYEQSASLNEIALARFLVGFTLLWHNE